jgi:hypothetical protein
MGREPLNASQFAKERNRMPRTQASFQHRLGQSEKGTVIHHHDRYLAMNPTTNVLYRARRFAVKHIEWVLGMEPHEFRVRLAEPRRVVLVSWGVDVEVSDSIHAFQLHAFRVPGGNDIDLMTRPHKPSREVARVILHPPDAMRRDDESDDTDPH